MSGRPSDVAPSDPYTQLLSQFQLAVIRLFASNNDIVPPLQEPQVDEYL